MSECAEVMMISTCHTHWISSHEVADWPALVFVCVRKIVEHFTAKAVCVFTTFSHKVV